MNHWDAAYLAASPFFLTAAAYKRWRHGKYRRSIPGMMGRNLPRPPLVEHRERVWMHSVSVGETVAAGAVYKLLRQRHPGWQFVSTTTTETGNDQARKSLPDADYYDFAPADFSWKVRRFLGAYRPSIYLFFETEIWPNILRETGRISIPVILVNGKLSENSARSYTRLRRLFRPSLDAVSLFLMQTEHDARRLAPIIGGDDRIRVTGNVKFDNLPVPLTAGERSEFRKRWGAADDALLVIAGSTHKGEEAAVFRAFEHLAAKHPEAHLVIAPRHPERFREVGEDLQKLGARIRFSSTGKGSGDVRVTILDEMGVLARAFGAGDIAIVGGAWNPIGGHNLLEPAAHGIPVIHGPHMHAQKEIMRIVREGEVTIEVGESQLGAKLLELAESKALRETFGRRGVAAARENAGAARRSVELIEAYLAERAAVAPA